MGFFLTQDVIESNLPLYQSDALELATTFQVESGLYRHKALSTSFLHTLQSHPIRKFYFMDMTF